MSPGSFSGRRPGSSPEAARACASVWHCPALLFPEPVDRLAAYLRDIHAPVTLRKTADAFQLDVPEKALRKKAILGGKGEKTPSGVSMELLVGAKLRLGDFLDSFSTPGASRAALVEVLEVR